MKIKVIFMTLDLDFWFTDWVRLSKIQDPKLVRPLHLDFASKKI